MAIKSMIQLCFLYNILIEDTNYTLADSYGSQQVKGNEELYWG